MLRKFIRSVFYRLKKAKIIMLHHVSKPDREYSPCVISTENLVDFLNSGEKYITLDELVNSLPRAYNGARIITIDDGLADLYTVAYPLFAERNIPFVAFISSDLIDKEGYITSEQLKEMSENPLVTIGSHGISHRCLDTLSPEEQKREIFESKKKLEEIIGKKVEYFSYSNGRYTKYTKKMVKKAGYKRAVGVRPRVYNFVSAFSRYDLPRFNLTDKTV